MPMLWRQTASHEWLATPLALSAAPLPIEVGGVEVQLLTWGRGAQRKIGLLTPRDVDVWISGSRVIGRLATIDHRDEILIGRERVFLSTESQPIVSVYAPSDESRRPKCPVCRTEIAAGQSIIGCPQCGRIHHYQEANGDKPEKKCWTYHPTCQCGHSTSLDGSGVWRPSAAEGE